MNFKLSSAKKSRSGNLADRKNDLTKSKNLVWISSRKDSGTDETSITRPLSKEPADDSFAHSEKPADAFTSAERESSVDFNEKLELICTRQQVLQEQWKNTQSMIEQLEHEQEQHLMSLVAQDKALLEQDREIEDIKRQLQQKLDNKANSIRMHENYKAFVEEHRQKLQALRNQTTITVTTLNDLGIEKDRILVQFTGTYLQHRS